MADIQNLEIANGHEATDEEVLKVIQKGVKTRRETAKLYEDKGLADKAAPETAEADFLETSCRRPPATRTTPKPSPTPWQK